MNKQPTSKKACPKKVFNFPARPLILIKMRQIGVRPNLAKRYLKEPKVFDWYSVAVLSTLLNKGVFIDVFAQLLRPWNLGLTSVSKRLGNERMFSLTA